jgi:hypothetical protein
MPEQGRAIIQRPSSNMTPAHEQHVYRLQCAQKSARALVVSMIYLHLHAWTALTAKPRGGGYSLEAVVTRVGDKSAAVAVDTGGGISALHRHASSHEPQ